jgi:hypothetical protein
MLGMVAVELEVEVVLVLFFAFLDRFGNAESAVAELVVVLSLLLRPVMV